MIINKNKAVCITGHRKISKDLDKNKLKEVLNKLIEREYNVFLIGMAVGFDTLCFQILEEIKKEREIKIIACIPCKNQDINFNESQKKEYERLIKKADEKILISENYTPYCMIKRNKFMVDNSSIVLSYLNTQKGGTANTVQYAIKNNIPVINIVDI